MKYKEFLDYLEINLEGYKVFMSKAGQYQAKLNSKRKKKWNDEKVEKAAYGMWKKAMENLYNTLKNGINSDIIFIWKDYIEKNNILESVSDSIRDMEFTSE